MIEFKNTDRGFRRGTFKDRYDVDCSIQKSSLATEDAIWLGAEDRRMHLTQDQVEKLIPLLQCFVETGDLFANGGSFTPGPVTLQYQNGFDCLTIEYANSLGFIAEPHPERDGWWRWRKPNNGTWTNAPLESMMYALDNDVRIST